MSTRRGNGEGSVVKRGDGRWQARLTLDGSKPKYFYGKTRQEVARRLAEATRDRDKGLPIVGERQTVGRYLDSWLQVAKTVVRVTTWTRYEQYIRLHVMPTLGKVALSKLTPQQVQTLYVAKLGEGLSQTTVHHLHMVLHRSLDAAMRLGLVQRNVCEFVDPPRMRRVEMQTLSPLQVRLLLAAAKGNRFEALIALALSTGMREGELLALKWSAVDLDHARLQVRSTVKRTPQGFVLSEAKTARGRRKLRLTPTAVKALQLHRTRQVAARQAAGTAWEDNDLVFPNSVGRLMEHGNLLRRYFWPLLRKAGLPRIRFHDLRHTAATLLLLGGINPKIVSEMLGHSSVAITLDLYSHVLPDMQRDATEALEQMLSEPGDEPPQDDDNSGTMA